MADVERLLSQYIAEHRSGGEADPLEYLDQLMGTDRKELAALIDSYLAQSPGRQWDPEAFHASDAERLTERLTRTFGGQAGLWPVVLPRLRERAQVMREEIVKRLADSLGVGDREQKVEGYYHQMEQGTLPSQGVDPKVLDQLGEILGTSGEFLRQAGRSLGGEAKPGQASPAYTRRVPVETADLQTPSAPSRLEELAEPWDEVDKLFRGGPD